MNKFLQRLREPSTWAGIAMLSVVMGLDPQKVAALGQVASAFVPFVPVDGGGVLAHLVTAAAAGAAVILPEAPHVAPAAPAPANPAPFPPIVQ